MAARVYDEVFGYIEDATKTLPGAAAPGELPGELLIASLFDISSSTLSQLQNVSPSTVLPRAPSIHDFDYIKHYGRLLCQRQPLSQQRSDFSRLILVLASFQFVYFSLYSN